MAGFGSQKLPVTFRRLASGPGWKQKPACKESRSEQMGDSMEITGIDHLTKKMGGTCWLEYRWIKGDYLEIEKNR